MKIRLEGKAAEVEAYAAVFREVFDVRHETRDNPNRPPSPLVRRYLHVKFRNDARPDLNPSGEG